MEQRVGILIALAVFAVIGLVMYFNLQPRTPAPVAPEVPITAPRLPGENPIGDPVEKRGMEGMEIVAVWLPPIEMEGMDLPQEADVIHLEADIHALEGNMHGFSRGAWIGYLTVGYEIIPLEPGRET